MTWALGGLAIWVVIGLIASRIVLFRLQDDDGQMKTFESVNDWGGKYTGTYERNGWPAVVGILWPILLIFSPIVVAVMLILWISERVGYRLLALGAWWYTKPSVRKAQRYGGKK